MSYRICAAALAAMFTVGCGGSSKQPAEPAQPTTSEAPTAASAPAAENPDTLATEEAGPPAPDASSAALTREQQIEAAWSLMQRLAEAAATDGDCKAKAAAMNLAIDDGEGIIAKMAEMQNDDGMKEMWDEKHGAESMQLMQTMATVSLKDCMADPDIGAAMMRLAGKGKKAADD